ncbi:MAG TPA: bifunctional hydroxymethylpyrimidine kinase/phosphomethylpyrimidine kinase [Candidatus Sulfomarinibacteraceae bacterium]|nr:bifunctional hydroxymethylpyrimidine kinase/phosphomethylpyrimidine kinase [Candidatus Sulfomarinibacteraceae bacterium]
MPEPAKVLTIAGSDSGGAAGLQADLKTFAALGAYGMSAVTVVTAQNSVGVQAAHQVPTELVLQQIDAVLDDYGAAAIKSGFMGEATLIAAVAQRLRAWREQRHFYLIVDPVLVNHRREAMFGPDVARAYCRRLLPLCDLVTPNWSEATLMGGQRVSTLSEARAAAQALQQMGAPNVLLTGWPEGSQVVDIFCEANGSTTVLRAPRFDTPHTHGSGDTLSAAITALLAQGAPLEQAIHQARAFTAAAIKGAQEWQMGAGHGPLNYWEAEWRSEIRD